MVGTKRTSSSSGMMVSVFRLVTVLLLLSVDTVDSKWNSQSATGSQRRRKYRFLPRHHRQHSPFFTINHHNDNPLVWPDLQDLNELATDTILDHLLDQILDTTTLTDNTLVHPYHPTRLWLWRQWKTTIFPLTLGTVVNLMVGALMMCAFLRPITHGDWKMWNVPSPQNPSLSRLRMIHEIWKNLGLLTTILLVVFVHQALIYWRVFLAMARALQENINDVHILLATHAKRNKNGTFTREAQRWLEEVASLLRLYHIFHWATHTRKFRILWTEQGLARMVTRGILSIPQKELLERQPLGLIDTERHYGLLEWMMYHCHQAQRNGILQGGSGLEQCLLEKACMVRTLSVQISHKVTSRMPLPYIHLVQVLVDLYLITAPLALYADLGIVSVIAMGILTLFYAGLLDLSKVLLDPLGNDQYHEDGVLHMDLNVLLREATMDSTKWMNAARKFPKSKFYTTT